MTPHKTQELDAMLQLVDEAEVHLSPIRVVPLDEFGRLLAPELADQENAYA